MGGCSEEAGGGGSGGEGWGVSLPASSKGTIKCHLLAKHVGGCDAPGVGSGLTAASGAVGVAWRGGTGTGGVGSHGVQGRRGDWGVKDTKRLNVEDE